MANNNRSSEGRTNQTNSGNNQHTSIGNQQGTTQTGAQNNGGEHRDQKEDKYTKDLRESGDRHSSNTKEES